MLHKDQYVFDVLTLKGHEPTTRHNFGSKPAEKRARSCIWFIWNVRRGPITDCPMMGCRTAKPDLPASASTARCESSLVAQIVASSKCLAHRGARRGIAREGSRPHEPSGGEVARERDKGLESRGGISSIIII